MKTELINELVLLLLMLSKPIKINEDVTADYDIDDENASEFSFKNKQMCFAHSNLDGLQLVDGTYMVDADLHLPKANHFKRNDVIAAVNKQFQNDALHVDLLQKWYWLPIKPSDELILIINRGFQPSRIFSAAQTDVSEQGSATNHSTSSTKGCWYVINHYTRIESQCSQRDSDKASSNA